MSQIFCPKHEEMEIRTIDFTEEEPQFLCEQCALDYQFQSKAVKLDKILYLFKLIDPKTLKAKSKPEYIISKMKILSNLEPLFNHFCNFDEHKLTQQWKILDGKIEEMLMTLQKLRQELLLHINQIIKNRQNLQENLNKIIKFEEFEQILEELKKQTPGDTQNQIEHRFFSYFINLRKRDLNLEILDTLIQTHIKLQEKSSDLSVPNFYLFKEQFRVFDSFSEDCLESSQPKYMQQQELQLNLSKILSPSEFWQLQKQISKQTKKIRPIVSELQFLSSYGFYLSCNNKSNLLFIMKQKDTKLIFGGFSCCQWQSQKNSFYVQDNQRTSFIFYQNGEEEMKFIYLKQDQERYAIYCDKDCGPIFGQQDLKITSDFTKAFWKMNGSYDFEEHNVLNKDQEMIIEQCEIYRIINY